jgi:two-component system, LytTR family, response regulator
MPGQSETRPVPDLAPPPDISRLKAMMTRGRTRSGYLCRIPVRDHGSIVLIPTSRVVTITAHGERLTIATSDREEYTMVYRLKDLERRLDPREFVRLNRATLVSVDAVARIVSGSGGTSRVTLRSGDEIGMSRLETRRLRRVVVQVLD